MFTYTFKNIAFNNIFKNETRMKKTEAWHVTLLNFGLYFKWNN